MGIRMNITRTLRIHGLFINRHGGWTDASKSKKHRQIPAINFYDIQRVY